MMQRQINHLVIVGGLILGLAGSVYGQALEEIIVTAQKREQSLQDVPISVNTVTGEFIADSNVTRMEDLSAYVPNLIVFSLVDGDQITLRGIASGFNPGFEQSVGTFVDGIYNGRDYQSRGRFMDLERIEILRGSQSTYFGNNTIGGALSITTKKPGDEFGGFVNFSWNPGEEDDQDIEAAVDVPLTDTFAVRVAAKRTSSDGFIENRFLNTTEDRRQALVGRITGVWEPTDTFSATFKAEYSKDKQRGRNQELTACPPPFSSGPPGLACGLGILAQQGPPLFLTPPPSGLDDVSERGSQGGVGKMANVDFYTLQARLYQLTMDYDFAGGHTLTSITGFSGYDGPRFTDLDTTPLAILGVFDAVDYEQWSQELRLTSPTGGTFEYIAGVYWQSDNFISDQSIGTSFTIFPPPGVPAPPLPPTQQDTLFDQDTDTFAIFGSLTWHVTDALRLTGGLRYTDVEKDLVRSLALVNPITGAPQPFLAGVPPLGGFPHGPDTYSRTDDDLTPSVNVQYDLTEDVMLYASYAEGFKAGGFDARINNGSAADITFDPEGVDAYEIGAKTTWLDGALNFNLTAFRSEYTDLQVSLFTGLGIVFLVDNAAAATTQGLELDGRWALTDTLTLSMAAAWMDAKYDEFPLGPCDHFDILNGLPGCPFPGENFADNELAFAPEWSGNVNLQHVYPFGSGYTLNSKVTVQFTSDYHTRVALDPRGVEDGYAKVDLRVALKKDNWELGVFVKNLTDERTNHLIQLTPTSTSSVGPIVDRQRYVMLQGRYDW